MAAFEEEQPLVIPGKFHQVAGLSVTRVLPMRKKRSVGPFVFVDHMAPHPGDPASTVVDVPPHPHIGLSTVTYLFEGALVHRDSTGVVQRIEPGAVNWMTAGRGVVHSERTPDELRANPPRLSGVQCWVALSPQGEDEEPHFEHYPASALPEFERQGAKLRLIAGREGDRSSPVRTESPLYCASLELEASARFQMESPGEEERGILVLSGGLRVNDLQVEPGTLVVFGGGKSALLQAANRAQVFLLGGPPLSEPRVMDWNFVATSRERIELAKELYRRKELGVIPHEGEQLPLPEDVR